MHVEIHFRQNSSTFQLLSFFPSLWLVSIIKDKCRNDVWIHVYCVYVSVRIKKTEERSKWDSRWIWVCVGGLVKQERTAMKVLRCKLKSTVKGHRSSLNENTIFQNEEKKIDIGRRNQCPVETHWEAGAGPGCFPLQSRSFTWRNIHASAVSRRKLSIGFNGCATKGGSEWCETEGLESRDPDFFSICAGRGKWLKELFRAGKCVSVCSIVQTPLSHLWQKWVKMEVVKVCACKKAAPRQIRAL